ncbi:MAG: IS110 family transposase [Oscillospiraceae bacterium]|nr:IS110 family transposase [Oscillospiraceae bacterium]
MKTTQNERLATITAKTIIVGVDIAKEEHWARITDSRGMELRKPIKVNNSTSGFENLLENVDKMKQKYEAEKVIIGMEPSGHYWRAFGWYLKLHESTPVLVGVNPYHVKQVRELDDNSQNKSDKKDALTIAHLIKDGRYFEMYMPEGEYAELRIYNEERQRIIKQVNRANNTIVAVLDEYFPELAGIWKDVTCATSLAIIKKAAFPAEIIKISKPELLAVIKKASNGTEGDKLASELVKAAENSVGVREGQQAAKSRLLRLIGELEYYQSRLSDVEKELETVMAKSELGEILQSMKGIGSIISAAFLGEVGDIIRFDDWRQVRRLGGMNLVEDSSGRHKSKTKISKRGRPYLRCMLYMAGVSCCMHNAEMKQYYRYLRERPKNPLKKEQAIVATGLKVMRIMFYMAKNREKYNPDKALGDIRKEQIASLKNA